MSLSRGKLARCYITYNLVKVVTLSSLLFVWTTDQIDSIDKFYQSGWVLPTPIKTRIFVPKFRENEDLVFWKHFFLISKFDTSILPKFEEWEKKNFFSYLIFFIPKKIKTKKNREEDTQYARCTNCLQRAEKNLGSEYEFSYCWDNFDTRLRNDGFKDPGNFSGCVTVRKFFFVCNWK